MIGGGFAGLAAAEALAAARLGPGVVLEREPVCGAHASGRNAGIFRLAESDPVMRALARRTLRLLRSIDASAASAAAAAPLWRRTGGLTLARAGEVARLERLADEMRREGVDVELLSIAMARRRFPHLRDWRADAALWCPDEGVIDVHGLLMRFRDRARACGVAVRTRCRAETLVTHAGRVTGVRIAIASERGARDGVEAGPADGAEEIAAPSVIDAAGAWAGRLGRAAGQRSRVPLRAVRRHLYITTGRPSHWPRAAPFIWTLGADELYARPEGDGLLASPCDACRYEPGAPGQPDVPPVDAAMREQLAARLMRHAPGLGDLAIRRGWACLRTFAPDDRPLIGADAALRGLYHLSGLGGSGVTTSGAIGALIVASILGRTTSWIDSRRVAADRLIPPSHLPATPPRAEKSAPVAENPAALLSRIQVEP